MHALLIALMAGVKRTALTAFVLGSLLATGACYDFDAPIDPAPTQALDPALMGKWRCLEAEPNADAHPANFVFGTARDRIYSIRFDVDDEEPSFFEAYASEVKGHTVLNVRDLAPKKGPEKAWNLARYTFLRPNVLQIQLVDDDVLTGVGQGPGAMRAALEQVDGTPGLYADFVVCARVSDNGTKAP